MATIMEDLKVIGMELVRPFDQKCFARSLSGQTLYKYIDTEMAETYTMPLNSLIAGLPKCELHVHVEGTLEPELMIALAARNGVRLPYKSVTDLRRAYQFSQLQDFLDLYYQGMSVLLHEQDYFDLAWAYLQRAHADNVCHVEMFFDPQGHTSRGVPFGTVVEGLSRACRKAADEYGMNAALIMCFLRHLDEADAQRTLDMALAHRSKIIGVGLRFVGARPPAKKVRSCFRARSKRGSTSVRPRW